MTKIAGVIPDQQQGRKTNHYDNPLENKLRPTIVRHRPFT
jgi:hypothetical protein